MVNYCAVIVGLIFDPVTEMKFFCIRGVGKIGNNKMLYQNVNNKIIKSIYCGLTLTAALPCGILAMRG